MIDKLLDWDIAFEWFMKIGCLFFVLAILACSAGTVMGLLWVINHFLKV
jgi:hypothetical protein